MSIILVLIPLSILFAVAFLAAFIWAVRSGQYEDTCTPSMRLLLDDPAAGVSTKKVNPPLHPETQSRAGILPAPGGTAAEPARAEALDGQAGCLPYVPARGEAGVDPHFLQTKSNQA